jgi:hypothetical protein
MAISRIAEPVLSISRERASSQGRRVISEGGFYVTQTLFQLSGTSI